MSVVIATIQSAANVGGGNQDITTAKLGGLTPKAVFVHVVRATANGTPSSNAAGCYGASDGTNRWVIAGSSENGVGTQDSYRRAANDELIMLLNPTDGTIDGEANFNSFITNGIRITWGNNPASAYLMSFTFFAGTDVSVNVGTITLGLENVEVNVNTVGFEPDVIILGSHSDAFDDTTKNFYYQSVGFCINDGADTQRCFAHVSDSGFATSLVFGSYSESYAVAQTSTAAIAWGGEVGTFDADGFSITPRLNNAGTDAVGYLALKFNNAINVYGETLNSPTSTGNNTVSGIGFTPQATLLGLTQLTAVTTSSSGDAGSVGMSMSDVTNQYCNSVQDEDAQPTMDTQSLADDQIINFPNDDGGTAFVATFTAFNSDGWAWNFSATKGTSAKWWLLAFGEEAPTITTAIPSFHQSTSLSINIWKPTIGSYTPRGTLVDDSIAFKLNSYSHTIKAIGGYWSSSFTINDRLDKIENWMDRLGYHVEVYSPSLVKIWEGFIANVFPNVGGLSVQRGPLTNIANRLSTVYSTVDTSINPPAIGMREKTTPVNDTDSQGIYGIIEKILSIGGATDATATQVGNTWLAENALPETSQSFNSNSSATEPGITVECLGYAWLLNFYVYNQVTNTGTRDISDIIQDVLAADPNTLFSTDYSGIDTNTLEVKRYENDDNTAWNYIKSLVGKGDASDTRHTFGIYNDRKAQYGAIPTDVAYLQRLADPKQRIETPTGLEVKPWEVLPNRWLFLPDFLIGRSQPSNFREDSRYVFIEQCTYTSPWGLSYTGGKVATLDQKLNRMGLGSAG